LKKIFKILRAQSLINKLVRSIIRSFYRKSARLSKKLMEYWPIAGQIEINVIDYKIRFYSNADDALVSKLYYGKKWESVELKIFALLSEKSSVIFDIGGNIGLYSLVASAASPNSKIYCFEPNPTNVERIKRNVTINKQENITLVEKAVSNGVGTLSFYLPKEQQISDVSSVYQAHTTSFSDISMREIEVETISIDGFIEKSQDNPHLIKIDIELSEYEALLGMTEYLNNNSPVIICEVFNDEVKFRATPSLLNELDFGRTKLVEDFLRSKKFYFYLITGLGILQVENLTSNPESSMYLFSKVNCTQKFYTYSQLPLFAREISA